VNDVAFNDGGVAGPFVPAKEKRVQRCSLEKEAEGDVPVVGKSLRGTRNDATRLSSSRVNIRQQPLPRNGSLLGDKVAQGEVGKRVVDGLARGRPRRRSEGGRVGLGRGRSGGRRRGEDGGRAGLEETEGAVGEVAHRRWYSRV
jgi:hypothetical protein